MANEATSALGTESTREALKKLTAVELENMARSLYGLNISNGMEKKELINLMVNASQKFKGNAEIKVVPENDETVEVPKGYVKIRVSPGPHNPKNRPIPLGLNFKMATIPVNRDVVIPGKWMSCLQDAVESRASIGFDDNGRETLIWTDQHKYPFSILEDNR